ncbi:MAG: hypothetical protein HQ582_25915 [Planctomycetes bacterium]|nr:hypothetical protein [Planctomycetota bacterium]
MNSWCSESTRHYIDSQPILWSVEQRFRREWETILRSVAAYFSRWGWKANFLEEPARLVQLYRPHWQNGWGGLHFEVLAYEKDVQRRRVAIGLHVESEVPAQEALASCLTQLLAPEEAVIRAETHCQLGPCPDRLLSGHLELTGLTVRSLSDVMQRLMQTTERFVEEALQRTGARSVRPGSASQPAENSTPTESKDLEFVGFSPLVTEWLRNQETLLAAEDLYRVEFRLVLDAVRDGVSNTDWKTNLSARALQFYRPHWQDGWNGAHFEVASHSNWFRNGTVHVGLHVEKDHPKHEAVLGRLRKGFQRYEPEILDACACRVTGKGDNGVLKRSLDLPNVSADQIGEALEKIMKAESFVEEALFLADKKTVWRTDLRSDDPVPPHKWHERLGTGEEGGWEFSPDGGRFNGPCIKCHGDKSNYHEGRNILTLNDSKPIHTFANNQKIYGLAVVHAPRGGTVIFHGESGKERGWAAAYRAECELNAAPGWQVVRWEATVSSPEEFDFGDEGVYAYVIVQAQTPESRLDLDCIEIGTCPEPQDNLVDCA